MACATSLRASTSSALCQQRNAVQRRRLTPLAVSAPERAGTASSSSPGTGPSSSSSSSSSASTAGPIPAIPNYTVNLFDALRFNGPAPELVNGRMAMIGFLAGAVQEVKTGVPLLQQAEELPLSTLVLLAVWVYASLVPILKGAKMEPFGIFTPRAEVANGRAAMLALAVIMALEYKAGGVPFF